MRLLQRYFLTLIVCTAMAGVLWSIAQIPTAHHGTSHLAAADVASDPTQTDNWWAYQSIRRPQVPTVKQPDWVTNPIDAIVLAKLEANDLQPALPASRIALLRRAYYDLIGLPPTPEQVDAFVQDESPDAYAKVIDQLLVSPHYGEKWGRHWLDVVRYAETNGYERDSDKPNVWRYRDYVIRSFNEDKPLDRFVLEQLAGDELDEVTSDSIIATGYYRLGIWDDEPTDPDQAFYDSLDDTVRTTGEVFLGMTVGCARCHDHKIDPISQRDYYRMMAFFHNTYNNIRQGRFKKSPFTLNTQRIIAGERELEEHEQRKQEIRDELDTLADEVAVFEAKVLETLTNNDKDDIKIQPQTRKAILVERAPDVLGEDEFKKYERLKSRLERIRKKRSPPLPQALCIKENGREAPDTFVLMRGNAHVPGDQVNPGFPSVLGFDDPDIPPPLPDAISSGRRRVLAEWLTHPDNPLFARVMVNRIWQYHFGRGIVATPNDFGKFGVKPTHPRLLDWLATELRDNGWKLKHMHRLIMLSSTYRMSSTGNEKALAVDPTNQLSWRFEMRRLTAEEIRDSILAANDTLNLEMYGESVYPPMPKAVLATSSMPRAVWGQSQQEDQTRRTIYAKVKRSLLMPMLAAHDQADTDASCPVRFVTTVPTQSLSMLNSDFMQKQAASFAERLEREAGERFDRQVQLALNLATCRTPTVPEMEENCKFVFELIHEEDLTQQDAMKVFCLMVLNMNEFVYVD